MPSGLGLCLYTYLMPCKSHVIVITQFSADRVGAARTPGRHVRQENSKAGDYSSHATCGRPDLARLPDRVVPRDDHVTLQRCH